jgi:hypothetical protein
MGPVECRTQARKAFAAAMANLDAIPLGYARDANGCALSFRDSKNSWFQYTRDKDGRGLTFVNHEGAWWNCSFSPSGAVATEVTGKLDVSATLLEHISDAADLAVIEVSSDAHNFSPRG